MSVLLRHAENTMKTLGSSKGLTTVEMVFAIITVGLLTGIYFILVESYKDRRMGEQAAKVLMHAARVQEAFFAREHRYFDAEVAGSSGEAFLVTPDGQKTNVQVPPRVVLSLKSRGRERAAFTGQAYYLGAQSVHSYDSETGKITTIRRTSDESG